MRDTLKKLKAFINVWGAEQIVHMVQNKNIQITTWSYSADFSKNFFYLKVLLLLVPEI